MIQRGGQVVINLLANVQQKTIEPHVQGVRLNHAIFASEEVIVSRWGV